MFGGGNLTVDRLIYVLYLLHIRVICYVDDGRWFTIRVWNEPNRSITKRIHNSSSITRICNVAARAIAGDMGKNVHPNPCGKSTAAPVIGLKTEHPYAAHELDPNLHLGHDWPQSCLLNFAFVMRPGMPSANRRALGAAASAYLPFIVHSTIRSTTL